MTSSPSRRALFAMATAFCGGFLISKASAAQGERTDLPQRTSARTEVTLTSAEMIGKTLRVIHPNEMVTMDYSEDRVNISLDDQGLITRIMIG